VKEIRVHPRVQIRHPDITDSDVVSAWRNKIALIERRTEEKDFLVALGVDANGRLLEMVSAQEEDGTLLVFHAKTPPTKRTLKELGLLERRK
jgi:hypothetical protein